METSWRQKAERVSRLSKPDNDKTACGDDLPLDFSLALIHVALLETRGLNA